MRLLLLFLVYLLDFGSGYYMTMGTTELVGSSGNTFGVFGSNIGWNVCSDVGCMWFSSVCQIRPQLLLWMSFPHHYLSVLQFSAAYSLILPVYVIYILSFWWCCKINHINCGCLETGCWEYLYHWERKDQEVKENYIIRCLHQATKYSS